MIDYLAFYLLLAQKTIDILNLILRSINKHSYMLCG